MLSRWFGHSTSLCGGEDFGPFPPLAGRSSSRGAPTGNYPIQGSGAKPSVDDLAPSRGAVLRRAATTLRSIETQPSTGGLLHRPLRGTCEAVCARREYLERNQIEIFRRGLRTLSFFFVFFFFFFVSSFMLSARADSFFFFFVSLSAKPKLVQLEAAVCTHGGFFFFSSSSSHTAFLSRLTLTKPKPKPKPKPAGWRSSRHPPSAAVCTHAMCTHGGFFFFLFFSLHKVYFSLGWP